MKLPKATRYEKILWTCFTLWVIFGTLIIYFDGSGP